MAGVGWLCSNATCMYAIMFLNANFRNICMCFQTQAFYQYLHVCMFWMNGVHIRKLNCVHLCWCVIYDLVCVSVRFYMISTKTVIYRVLLKTPCVLTCSRWIQENDPLEHEYDLWLKSHWWSWSLSMYLKVELGFTQANRK